MNIVELKEICVSSDGKRILDDLSLSIKRGEFLAITGPNGGGKTTLLRVILRLLKPDSGTVRYFDRQGKPTSRLPIGYLPQKSNIDAHFPITVGEAVRQGQIRGFLARRSKEDEERFGEVAELCGIDAILARPIGVLSGGQLQRTLLARAIVSRPELLVLDEPLSYVDKSFEQKIYSLMEQLASHTTIILVSHEMSAFDRMATNSLIIGC